MAHRRLAIITTHPIQYYAPLFRLLHERSKITIRVFYTWGEAALDKFDPGFRQKITWDVPLTEGYPFEWAENTSKDPGTHHFKGIITPALTRQIEAWGPDAILCFGWAFDGHLRCIRYFKGKVPVYFRGDSTLLDRRSGLVDLLRTLYLKWVYRHIDHAFYVGTANYAYFLRHGLQEGQLHFAPHAIDNARFTAVRHEKAKALRSSLGMATEDVLVLFAGKLEEKKSPLLLLNAFLKLAREDVHLLFVGNGIQEAQLKEIAKGQSRIHFIDFKNQSEMPVFYQASDLFCLPSAGPGETWGLAVNEAMACGKAILVSDKVGCGADLVKEKYNGMIFHSESLSDLSNKLSRLLKEKANLLQYGMNSRSIIEQWNFTRIAETVEKKLNEEI